MPDLCHDCATLAECGWPEGNCTRPESVMFCLLQGLSPHFLHHPLWRSIRVTPMPAARVRDQSSVNVENQWQESLQAHSISKVVTSLCPVKDAGGTTWGSHLPQTKTISTLTQKEKALLANPNHFCTSKSSGQMEARTKIWVKTSSPKPFAFRSKFHMF